MLTSKLLWLAFLAVLYTTTEARRLGSWSGCNNGERVRTRRCSGNCRGVSLKQSCVISGVWGAWEPCAPGQYETHRTCHMTDHDALNLALDDDRPVKCGGHEFQIKLCGGGSRSAATKTPACIVDKSKCGRWSACATSSDNKQSKSRECVDSCGITRLEETSEGCSVPGPGRSAVSIGDTYKDDFCGREDKYWATLSTGSGILFSHGSYGQQSLSTPASPWSHLYENNMMTCNYLKVDECQKIAFSFGNDTVFEIEQENHPSPHCPYDWLEIHDQNGDKIVERTCGDTAPADFSSSTNKVVVIFRTDHNVRKQGFRIVWVATGGCNWSDWSDEGCDDSTGFRNYTRTCTKDPVDCDCTCPGDDNKFEVCEVPCGYGDWSQWSECDSMGDQTRHRYGDNPVGRPDKGECPTEDDHRNVKVDGQWTEWADWGMCETSGVDRCTHTRERFCAAPCPSCGGAECGEPQEEKQPCAQDGGWSDWSAWTGCDPELGRSETRTRSCDNPTACEGGADCVGPDEEERCCPLDCGWTDYFPAGECDKTTGTQVFSRWPVNPAPSCDGVQCEGSCFDVRNCTVHCEWGEWFAFSGCDTETAKQFFVRHEAVTAKNGGDPCDCTDTDKCDAKIEPCDSGKCRPCDENGCTIVDGQFGDWTEWTCCDTESSERTRQRACDSPAPQNGGLPCQENSMETEACGNDDKCPSSIDTMKDFSVSDYLGEWYEQKSMIGSGGRWPSCTKFVYSQVEGNASRISIFSTGTFSNGAVSHKSGSFYIKDPTVGEFQFENADDPIEYYWILDTDYTGFAIVYSCSELVGKIEYAWILSRAKHLDESTMAYAIGQLANVGVQEDQLEDTVQNGSCPGGTGKEDKCPSSLDTKKDFIVSGYMGEWYEQKSMIGSGGRWPSCTKFVYGQVEGEENKISIMSSGTLSNGTVSHKSGTFLIDDQTVGEFQFENPENPIKNYWILDTDYNSFAIVYSCFEFEGKMEYAWILSRTKHLNEDAMDYAIAKLAAIGVHEDQLEDTVQNESCIHEGTGKDKCPSSVDAMKDFSVSDYLGEWYEQKSMIGSGGRRWPKCTKFVYGQTEGRTDAISVYWTGTLGNGALTYKSDSLYIADLTIGEFIFENPDYPIEYYWILDTDYDNFAIIYSCFEFEGTIEYAWILSRSPKLEDDEMAYAIAKLAAIGVHEDQLEDTDQNDSCVHERSGLDCCPSGAITMHYWDGTINKFSSSELTWTPSVNGFADDTSNPDMVLKKSRQNIWTFWTNYDKPPGNLKKICNMTPGGCPFGADGRKFYDDCMTYFECNHSSV